MIFILSFKKLSEEKIKVINKVLTEINSNKNTIYLTPLELLFLLTDLGEQEKKLMPHDLQQSFIAQIIKGKKIKFNNKQIAILYKITKNFKMCSDYNAVLFTLLQTSAGIEDNINKVKNSDINLREKYNLIEDAETLLNINHNNIMSISKNVSKNNL